MADNAPGKATIINKRGLHARAAARFVSIATMFEADIEVARADDTSEWVPGDSIMGLLMLAAGPGTDVLIRAEGAQADEAVKALVTLIEAGFEEEE